MTLKLRKLGHGTLILLFGEALVESADDVVSQFKSLIDIPDHQTIVMDLSGLQAVDVTFIQALLSLQNSFSKNGRTISVRKLPPEHCVLVVSELLGIKLGHHFEFVEAVS